MRTFAALVAVSTVVAQLPAGAVGQVIPPINAPGQQLNAPPPNTMLTLLVPVQLQELHPTITRAAVECELISYDANGNRFSNDAQGWSDTLAVPPDGNLSVDVVVHMQEAFNGSRDGMLTQYLCDLLIGQATGDLVTPSEGEMLSGFAFRARSDRAFTIAIQDTIP